MIMFTYSIDDYVENGKHRPKGFKWLTLVVITKRFNVTQRLFPIGYYK